MDELKITWQSPSNIALIKYWGKHGNQLPNNASLSLTLAKAHTQTSVALKKKKTKSGIETDFIFEGKKNEKFAEKINAFLQVLGKDFSFLKNYRLAIRSENSFPHSAGIASSASAMSALALCILSLDENLKKKKQKDFLTAASYYARLGSGSATRSIFPHFAVWGKTASVKNSSDNHAIQYPEKFHASFRNMNDTILIVHEKEKAVSSRAGHSLMNDHSMAFVRYANAEKRLQQLLQILKTGDWENFASIVEAEALELHALMMTSSPSYILLRPETLTVIDKIRKFRQGTKIPACFTLDAGPNIHLLYPDAEKNTVRKFIRNDLQKYCAAKPIYDAMGNGPEQIAAT